MIFSIAVVVVCAVGIYFVSRRNFEINDDAGNGWKYIYWQPWRVRLIGCTVAFIVAITVAIALLGRFGMQPGIS